MIDAMCERKTPRTDADIPQVNASPEQEDKIQARIKKRMGEIHGRR